MNLFFLVKAIKAFLARSRRDSRRFKSKWLWFGPGQKPGIPQRSSTVFSWFVCFMFLALNEYPLEWGCDWSWEPPGNVNGPTGLASSFPAQCPHPVKSWSLWGSGPNSTLFLGTHTGWTVILFLFLLRADLWICDKLLKFTLCGLWFSFFECIG